MSRLFNSHSKVATLAIFVAALGSEAIFARLQTSIMHRAAHARQIKIARLVKEGVRNQQKTGHPLDAHSIPELQQQISKLVGTNDQLEKVSITADFLRRVRDVADDSKFEPLLAAGNLQEIIWQLRDENLVAKAEQIEALITDVLKNHRIVAAKPAAGGVHRAHAVSFANGVRAIVKPWHQTRAVGLSRLDRLIGTNIFPLTVLRQINGQQHSVQLLIERAMTNSEIGILLLELQQQEQLPKTDATLLITLVYNPLYHERIFNDETRRMLTLALLGSYHDSGTHNIMTPSIGRPFLIDGGEAFEDYKKLASLKAYYSGYDYDRLIWTNFRLNLNEGNLRNIGRGKYFTDAAFIVRLENITSEDLEAVIAPLFTVFTAEELAIFTQLDHHELPVHDGEPQLNAQVLRAFWQGRGVDDQARQALQKRYHLYYDLLSAPKHIQGIITDYVDAAKELQTITSATRR